MTDRALRLLDLVSTVAVFAAGVFLFLVLPDSTQLLAVPVTIVASLLNTLLFVLLRRLVRGRSQSAARL